MHHGWFLISAIVIRFNGSTNIDIETLEATVALGFTREQVKDALRHQVRNKASVTYFLLLDNRRNLYGGYLGAEFEQGELETDSRNAQMLGQQGGIGSPTGASPMGHRRPSQIQSNLMQQRLVTSEQRWMLGKSTTMAAPDVMNEIFRVLTALKVNWKKIGPYNLKCRFLLKTLEKYTTTNNNGRTSEVGSPQRMGDNDDLDTAMEEDATTTNTNNTNTNNEPTTPDQSDFNEGQDVGPVMKFELQVYKMKDDRFMIDFQRIEGGVVTSLDVVSLLMKRLQLR